MARIMFVPTSSNYSIYTLIIVGYKEALIQNSDFSISRRKISSKLKSFMGGAGEYLAYVDEAWKLAKVE